MKTLLLVRHAKSSWETPGQSDFDRPLNDRGKKDAPEMAERVKDRGLKPDAIVSSPARRAKKTAKYFAEAFDIDKEDIILVESLYLATQESFEEAIRSQDDKIKTMFLFAHNPGITTFASGLSDVQINDMPTCAVFAVQADTNKWTSFMEAEKKFLFLDYPKNPLP